jgi:F-type H+-transporting ATPase subunit epsilon
LEKKLSLEIITSDRFLFKGDVISVSAPGVLGEFQVLYNHSPLVSSLEIGRIKVETVNGAQIEFATSGGILEVRDNKIIILGDSIERKDEIDIERAKKALEKSQDLLKEKSIKSEDDVSSLKRAKNRLKISGK